MTVKELIKELEQYDEDLQVIVNGPHWKNIQIIDNTFETEEKFWWFDDNTIRNRKCVKLIP